MSLSQPSNASSAISSTLSGIIAVSRFEQFLNAAVPISSTVFGIDTVSRVSQQINSIAMAIAGAERIFELMNEAPESNNGTVTLVNIEYGQEGNIVETKKLTKKWAWKKVDKKGNVEYVPLKGFVEVKDLTFGYVPEKTVLKNVSFYAKPGQKIAFVGATGAGKTTITNLINRFYEIKKGQIIYDGIDVKDINKDDLRRSLGMVLQDTNLFTGTIKDNISKFSCFDNFFISCI